MVQFNFGVIRDNRRIEVSIEKIRKKLISVEEITLLSVEEIIERR